MVRNDLEAVADTGTEIVLQHCHCLAYAMLVVSQDSQQRVVVTEISSGAAGHLVTDTALFFTTSDVVSIPRSRLAQSA